MGTPDFADAHPGYGLRLRGPKLGRKSRRENVLCWLFRQHLVARMERSEIRERRASGKTDPRISLALHPGYGLNPGYERYRLGHRRSRAEKRIALTGGALSCHVAPP